MLVRKRRRNRRDNERYYNDLTRVISFKLQKIDFLLFIVLKNVYNSESIKTKHMNFFFLRLACTVKKKKSFLTDHLFSTDMYKMIIHTLCQLNSAKLIYRKYNVFINVIHL